MELLGENFLEYDAWFLFGWIMAGVFAPGIFYSGAVDLKSCYFLRMLLCISFEIVTVVY